MNTLLLDTTTWDLTVDIDGNIAMASDPYSEAQDAASAIKLSAGELWYDTTQGVDYGALHGRPTNLPLAKAQFVAAAETVPNVASAQCFITSLANRAVAGQVQITDESGQTAAANF